MNLRTLAQSRAILVCVALLLVLQGCKKADTVVQTPSSLTTAVVADMVAATLGGSGSTQGVTAQMNEAAIVAGGGAFPKAPAGVDLRLIDTTIVREGTNGSVIYRYTFHYSLAFTNLGNRLDFRFTVGGTFDTPRISSADSANANMILTHIIDLDTAFTLNSTYNRFGTQQSKVGEHLQFTSTTVSTFTDVLIGKLSQQILSGTGVMTVSGHIIAGGSFSYTVLVTFLGNGQALIVVNGVSFTVNLAAGTATAVSR